MGVDGETPDMDGLLAALRDLPGAWPEASMPSWVKSAVWLVLAQRGHLYRSVFPPLKWIEVWVKLAPACQWQLATACALEVRDSPLRLHQPVAGEVYDSSLWKQGPEC